MSEPPVVTLPADANFELALTVSLASLTFQQRNEGCRIIVLHDRIPDDMRRRVERVVESPSTIEWLAVEDDVPADLPRPPYLPRASLYPLVLEAVLPADVSKVVYLDSDVVVRRALTELWETELGDSLVAAVRDAYMPWFASARGLRWRELGVRPDAPYFNNGVMLVNLDRWRDQNVLRQAVSLQRSHAFRFGDQDAVNVVAVGRWTRLHPRWNVGAGFFTKTELIWVAEPTEELNDAVADPGIVHYNGPIKPWHFGCELPFVDLWFEWLDRTPHRGWRPRRPPLRQGARRRLGAATRALLGK